VFINAANDYNNDWSYYWSGLVNKTTTTTTTPAVTPTPTPTTTVAPTVVTTTQEYACFVKVGSAYTTTLLSTNSAISTPIECCNLCGATSNCVGFSLNPTCQLFSAGFGNILSNGTISLVAAARGDCGQLRTPPAALRRLGECHGDEHKTPT
jgi:hypothetical protein